MPKACSDAMHPDWEDPRRCFDWRNYINGRLRELWWTFSAEQKQAIADNAQEQANKEDWD